MEIRRTAGFLAGLVTIGALVLTGCARIPPQTETSAPPAPAPTPDASDFPTAVPTATPAGDTTPQLGTSTCGPADTACQTAGHLRWSIPLDTPVGLFADTGTTPPTTAVAPLPCAMAVGDAPDSCAKPAVILINNGLAYFVSGDYVVVFNADSGLVFESGTDPTTAELVTNLPDEAVAAPDGGPAPSPGSLGLTDSSRLARRALILDNGESVDISVGCLAGDPALADLGNGGVTGPGYAAPCSHPVLVGVTM